MGEVPILKLGGIVHIHVIAMQAPANDLAGVGVGASAVAVG
jgi:hypothetical protein